MIGKYIFILGVVIAVAGLLIWIAPNLFNWIGRLPGDIRIEKPGFSIYIPIVTMIIFSMLLTLVGYIIKKISGNE
jgi:hypothetical protein